MLMNLNFLRISLRRVLILESLASLFSRSLIKSTEETNKLKKLSINLEGHTFGSHQKQELTNMIKHLKRLIFLDLKASEPSMKCLMDLYNQTNAQKLGISINRPRPNDKLTFLSSRLAKLALTNITISSVTQVMRTIVNFENLQSLSISRLEESNIESFLSNELNTVQHLSNLLEFNLNISLGSLEATQALLRNISLPASLEHLHLWLTGVCLNDNDTSLRSFENFGKCITKLKSLTSLSLLWDFRSGLDHLNTLITYLPYNMDKIRTFRLYTCSSDYCQRASIQLSNILDLIPAMKNLETLFLNFEDISLIGEYANLDKVRNIRQLYILSTTTKISSAYEYHRIIDFIRQNHELRSLTFECSPDGLSKKEINKLSDMIKTLRNLEHFSLRIKVKDVLIDSFYGLGEAMRTLRYLKERFIEVTWQSVSSDNFNESMCSKIFSPNWKFIMNYISIHDEKGKQLV